MRPDLRGYGDESKGCLGKRRYEPHQGDQARKQARRLHDHGRGGVMAYRCPWCDGWHVGHRLKDPKALALRSQQASGPASSLTGDGHEHEQQTA